MLKSCNPYLPLHSYALLCLLHKTKVTYIDLDGRIVRDFEFGVLKLLQGVVLYNSAYYMC